MRPSRVEVDLGAIKANVATLAAQAAPAEVIAVVKANAYGHGDVPASEAALEAGASWLAVALVEEAARLREAGIEAPLLLLSEPPVADAGEIRRWGVTPSVYRPEFVDALASASDEVVDVQITFVSPTLVGFVAPPHPEGRVTFGIRDRETGLIGELPSDSFWYQ